MNSHFPNPLEPAMHEALRLARLAQGQTAPNPMVGAVVVSSLGEIVGRGFHPKAGEAHAEVFALREALEKTQGNLAACTLIVTLEPCNHFGRTPPCVDSIIASGIKRVVVGTLDPNPLMQGKSISTLREHGILVDEGLSKKDCEKLIRGFNSILKLGRPFVTLKCATSLDGKIATSAGESKWITSEPAREIAHLERSEHDAILVGVGTVLADDPKLTARKGEHVLGLTKIILDTRLRTPIDSKIFKTPGRVFLYCDMNFANERKKELEAQGAEVVPTLSDPRSGGIMLGPVLRDLTEKGVQDLLVEGGSRVLGSFVREGTFDRMLHFIAPRIMGSTSRDVFEGLDVKNLENTVNLENVTTRLIGRDIVIEGVRTCLPV